MEIARNLARRKLRNGLTIGGIVIGILALTTMGSMAEKINLAIDGGVRFFSDHIPVSGAGNGFGSNVVRVDRVQAIDAVDGVAAAFPTIGLPAHSDVTLSFGPGDTIIGNDLAEASHQHYKLTLAGGRQLAANGEVVLGADFAKELSAHPGSTITLPVPPKQTNLQYRPHHYTVVGILDKTLTAPDNFAFVTFADAQVLLGDALPPAIQGAVDPSTIATGIDVFGKPGVNLDQLAARINQEVPGVKALPPSELIKLFQESSAVFTAITTGSAVLALVIGGLSVINTMLMAVAERVREIGLKKAVGAHTKHVMGEFLVEATAMGLIGGVVGLALGWTITTSINGYTAAQHLTLFLLTPRLALFALVFAIGLGAAAGVIPALRAARMDPVQALRSQ